MMNQPSIPFGNNGKKTQVIARLTRSVS